MILVLNIVALITGLASAFLTSAGKRKFLASATLYCISLFIISLYLQIYAQAFFYLISIVLNVVTYKEWNKNAYGDVSYTFKMKQKERMALLLGLFMGIAIVFSLSYSIQAESNATWIIAIDAIMFTINFACIFLTIKKKVITPWLWLIVDIVWMIYVSYVVFYLHDYSFVLLMLNRLYFTATTIMAIVMWNRQLKKEFVPSFFISPTINSLSVKNNKKYK